MEIELAQYQQYFNQRVKLNLEFWNQHPPRSALGFDNFRKAIEFGAHFSGTEHLTAQLLVHTSQNLIDYKNIAEWIHLIDSLSQSVAAPLSLSLGCVKALLLWHLGSYQQALHTLDIIQEKAVKVNQSPIIAYTQYIYCLVHYSLEEYTPAEKNGQLALAFFSHPPQSVPLIEVYNALGMVQFAQKVYAQAKKHFENSRKLALETNTPISIARATNNLAAIEEQEGNYRKAFDYFGRAAQIFSSNGCTYDLIKTEVSRARLHQKLGHHTQAAAFWERVQALQSEIPDNTPLYTAIRQLISMNE